MDKLRRTPSQTVGPFFAYSLTAEQYGYEYNSIISGSLVNGHSKESLIFIKGSVFDGRGDSISDALIELWQTDQSGQYRSLPIQLNNNGFTGFGRSGTGANPQHRFIFTTLKPGCISKEQAPHVNVILFMRGSLHQLYTRIYFSDEDNEGDALLNTIDGKRRKTLIALRQDVEDSIEYHFNIHIQGEEETVFFDLGTQDKQEKNDQ